MVYQDVVRRLRTCKKCGEIKSFDEFVKQKQTTYGICWTCKQCRSKEVKFRNSKLNLVTSEYELNNIYRLCNECKENKLLKEFPINRISKYGRAYQCKCCRSYQSIRFAKDNPEIMKKRNKERYQKNKAKKKENDRQYYKENKDRIKKRVKKYRSSSEAKENRNKKELTRRRIDIKYKISINLRGRLRHIVKNRNHVIQGTTEDLLGCSLDFFKSYIESQFKGDMTWDNYGLHTWHLDHIKPLSSFDLTNESEQKKAMHYTNLQPLLAIDNLKKGSKLDWSPNE